MNAVAPPGIAGPHIIETQLRLALTDVKRRDALLEATGWDASMPSKVMAGATGITIEKLDALLKALGLVVTTSTYMDYLAQGNMIGSNCHCARMSMGQCGPRG